MAIGDFTLYEQSSAQGGRGGQRYNVAPNATAINAGEPVATTLGTTSVFACLTNAGQIGTDYIVGIATTASTTTPETSVGNGFLEVIPNTTQNVWLVAPKVAATWNTQLKYDNLVGSRVLIDLTSGTYTVLATDGSSNGLVVMPLNITKFPGKVAVSFRTQTSNLF